MSKGPTAGPLTRRDFVRRASVGAAAAASLVSISPQARGQEPEDTGGPLPKRVLGKTGEKVSVVCFGSYGLTNPGVLEAALDAGVNFIDTGPNYAAGNAERVIGQVMEKRRDEAVLSTKFMSIADGVTKAELLEQLNDSLRRLRTDHIDVMQVPMVDSPGVLGREVIYEAFAEVKEAGRVKHLGFSAHDANLPDVVREAINHDEIAAMLLRYNIMQYEDIDDVLAQAREQEVGAIAMKVGAGNREEEVRELAEDGDMKAAAVRWALSNPSISSVCCGMLTFADVKRFTEAAAKPVTEADLDLLRRYRLAFDGSYCRSCRTCEGQCPAGVAVGQVSRFAMYFKYYGFEKEAMRLYAELPGDRRAAACGACSGPCGSACPHGLATREMMAEAHRMLT